MVQKESFGTRTTKEIIKERYQEFGVRGFYRGMSMQLVRSVPVHALNFYVYENVFDYCTRLKLD